MTPQELCDILDEIGISTSQAAREMGIHETTLGMMCAGRRYPSHGGREITEVPKLVANAVRLLAASYAARSGTSD